MAIVRLLAIPMLFILDKLWSDSLSDTWGNSNHGLHFSFSFWEYLMMYSLVTIYAINTIVLLVLSFKPGKIPIRILQNKIVWRCFLIAEMIILPALLIASYGQIQDSFFPPKPTLIGEVINFFIPPDPGYSATETYDKLRTLDFCLLTCCSIFFVVCFWRFYRAVSANQQQIPEDAQLA